LPDEEVGIVCHFRVFRHERRKAGIWRQIVGAVEQGRVELDDAAKSRRILPKEFIELLPRLLRV